MGTSDRFGHHREIHHDGQRGFDVAAVHVTGPNHRNRPDRPLTSRSTPHTTPDPSCRKTITCREHGSFGRDTRSGCPFVDDSRIWRDRPAFGSKIAIVGPLSVRRMHSPHS